MSVITVNGQVTSYDLPQYIGELFRKGTRPNAFLRLVGGISGALGIVNSTEFSLGVDYELGVAVQPAIVEGAAPSNVAIGTEQATNVVQIFQEGVELTYTAQSKGDMISGLAVIPGVGQGALVTQPNSLEWQIERKMEIIAMQCNVSFLKGTYQKPANNATGRKTRGLITAVTTNLFANGAVNRALTKAIFENALRDSMVNGAFIMGDEVYCLADATQLGNISALYVGVAGQAPFSREVFGFAARTIVTQWATVNLIWEPDMPAGKILLFQPKKCHVTALPIKNKGILFAEPLAKAGSSDKWQVYGELGIDYTHEVFHAVIADLS